MNVRDQDRLGLYVAIMFVTFAVAVCLSVLFRAPTPRVRPALIGEARR